MFLFSGRVEAAENAVHAMDQVIGVMLIIVLIGLLTDKILFAPIERFLHRRCGTALR